MCLFTIERFISFGGTSDVFSFFYVQATYYLFVNVYMLGLRKILLMFILVVSNV